MKRYSFVVAVVLGCFLGTVISQLIIIPQIAIGTTAPKPGIVRASNFELVDNNGTKRASLEMENEDEDKTAALYLWDSNGKPLVALKASPESSAILMNIEDKPVLGFGVEKNKGALGFMNDAKTGKPGISMSATERGAGIMIFEGGRPRAVQTSK